jgi:hypothetical protein
MTRYREYDDGTRVFPVRGKPPPEMPGFERDSGNPFVMHPILPQCPIRISQQIITECCGRVHSYWACQAGGLATYKHCKRCTESGQREVLIQQVGIQRAI